MRSRVWAGAALLLALMALVALCVAPLGVRAVEAEADADVDEAEDAFVETGAEAEADADADADADDSDADAEADSEQADAVAEAEAEAEAAESAAQAADAEADAAVEAAAEASVRADAAARVVAKAEARARARAGASVAVASQTAEYPHYGEGDGVEVTFTYCSPCGFYQHVTKLAAIMTSRFPKLKITIVPNERANYAFEVKIDDDTVYNKVFGDGWVNPEQVERLLYLLRLRMQEHWPGDKKAAADYPGEHTRTSTPANPYRKGEDVDS